MNVLKGPRQRRALLLGCLCVSFALSYSTLSRAFDAALGLTDSANHPPPSSGTYAYNSFVPANTGGASYVDPVFGTTIRRLTTDNLADDIYARNMWWNADGTKFAHRGQIVNTTTGQVTHNVPRGSFTGDAGFDPVDPNVYYYYSGSTIRKVVLNSGGTTSESTFLSAPASIQSLGSSVNWWSADGRLFLVKYNNTVRVYEKTSTGNVLYGGAIDGSTVGNGWIGLTPSGQHVMSYGYGYSPYGMGSATAWDVDKNARTVGPGKYFWGLCGDHGVPISATDGKDYLVVSNCYSQDQIVRVSPENDARNYSTSSLPSAPGNKVLKSENWQNDRHYSSVAKGPLRDWVFASMEYGGDGFNSGTGSWAAYRQEIIGINVLTGEIRRLAHHRSRGLTQDYSYQPRLSVSWGGEYVGWASNFNQSGKVNIFAAVFGGPGAGSGSGSSGGGTGDTTAPSVSITAPSNNATVSGNVTVTANASDDEGVASVQFRLGSSNLGSLITNGTYSVSWNTTASTDGNYVLTAIAKDAAGNTTTSSPVNVTVKNTTAPVISAVSASGITSSSATIAWQTNQPSDTQVEYGTSASYGSQTPLNTSMVSSHSATLSGLAAGTTYNFRVKSKNSSGMLTTSGNFTFTTAAAAPTAPAISGVTASSITTSGATISWQTNQSSDTQVEYGTTMNYGSQTALNSSMVTSHSVTLSGLAAGTTYNYRVKSKNSSGVLSTSGNFTFTTASSSSGSTGPVISGVTVSSIAATGALISWQTNQASDTQVQYGTTTNYGSQTFNGAMVSSHTSTLSGLQPGTTYHFRVRSRNSAGVRTTSGDFTFTTLSSNPTFTLWDVQATWRESTTYIITWKTSVPANSRIEYGLTTSYGQMTFLDTDMEMTHWELLPNLQPWTTYHYRVISTDANGRVVKSADQTLRTGGR